MARPETSMGGGDMGGGRNIFQPQTALPSWQPPPQPGTQPNPYAVNMDYSSLGGFGQPNWRQMQRYTGPLAQMDPRVLQNLYTVSNAAWQLGGQSTPAYMQALNTVQNLMSGASGKANVFLAPEREALAASTNSALTQLQNRADIPEGVRGQMMGEAIREGAGRQGQLKQDLFKWATGQGAELGLRGTELGANIGIQGAKAAGDYQLGVGQLQHAQRSLGAEMEFKNRALAQEGETAKLGFQTQVALGNAQSALQADSLRMDTWFKNFQAQLEQGQWDWQRNTYFPWIQQTYRDESRRQDKAGRDAKLGKILSIGGGIIGTAIAPGIGTALGSAAGGAVGNMFTPDRGEGSNWA